MKCPKCAHEDTSVLDSRVIEEGSVIRRRRECAQCSHRFTTFERISSSELMVIKKDGTKELYNRSKIKKALLLAFAKRKFSIDQIEEIIAQLEAKRSSSGSEISSQQIGKDITILLRDIDPVAYVRFASVYLNFDNLEDFKLIINQ